MKEEKIFFWKLTVLVFLISLVVFNMIFEIKVTPRFWSSFSKEEKEDNEKAINNEIAQNQIDENELEKTLFPDGGYELPVIWNDLGAKLIEKGVIDKDKMIRIYNERGGLTEYEKQLLTGDVKEKLKITRENSGLILNLFWAFGLSNKNPILEKGPMVDKRYGGAQNFASTGGWNIAKGNTMDHYSKHAFIKLTKDQQNLVEKVSKNIYRPCCDNSTFFPDCNHGMAMLGFLELMASQGVSEEEMYKGAMLINTYWFPSNYLTIAKYFEKENIKWDKVDPKEILSNSYSSFTGFQDILSKVDPVETKGGGACNV